MVCNEGVHICCTVSNEGVHICCTVRNEGVHICCEFRNEAVHICCTVRTKLFIFSTITKVPKYESHLDSKVNVKKLCAFIISSCKRNKVVDEI